MKSNCKQGFDKKKIFFYFVHFIKNVNFFNNFIVKIKIKY